MSDQAIIELEACRVLFFSPNDERAFFNWLSAISCVTTYAGRGDCICFNIDTTLVDEDALRELLALFHRYGVEMAQLYVLDRPEFAEWFRDSRAYWFGAVFGNSEVVTGERGNDPSISGES